MNRPRALFPLSSFFLPFPHVARPLGRLSPHFSRTHPPPESHSHSSAGFGPFVPVLPFVSCLPARPLWYDSALPSAQKVRSLRLALLILSLAFYADSSPSDHVTQSSAGDNPPDRPSHTHCENLVSRFPLHSPSSSHALVRTS